MSNFNIELPLNPTSYGQIGYGIALELFNRGLNPNIFPIGPVDLSPFIVKEGFSEWLSERINKADTEFSVDDPTISLWHIMGSHKRVSKKNILWTAHETTELTPTEINICKNFDKVLTTSTYSRDMFNKFGIEADWCPNFFDDLHFYRTNREYKNEDKITTFGLFGKLEHRKNTINIMVAWANKYAGNKDYRLTCCIFNPFLPPEVQSNHITSAFKGKLPWNINILPFQEKNVDYNKVVNSIDIDLTGLSGAEGWNLPCMSALCLGKQAVVLNAHSHKDFANSENSILVEPSGVRDIYDNHFFHKGAKFNQGLMHVFSLDSVTAAFEVAEESAKIRNTKGEELKEKFSVKNTVDILLNSL